MSEQVQSGESAKIIVARDVTTAYGSRVMHDNVSFSVKKGEIYGFLGGKRRGQIDAT
ncbi:hypothetical protein [uncultured Campylobacter sp.]|uniref:hypothetical protein n=1 Tax=uncultured Campylobacter sp. TaxID=218934 RepID=UPI002628399B|nr:hypothetical protein [uncultured Campylobacter sp.]